MEDCLFCKIIKGEIPSTKVYEDELVYGFKDINPAAPIHILVVPRKHIDCLTDLTDEDEKYVWAIHKAMNKIAEEQGFKENGSPLGDYFSFYSNGNTAQGKMVGVYYPAYWEPLHS